MEMRFAGDKVVSVPFILAAFAMFSAVFVLLFVLRNIIDCLLDSTVLEIKYSYVSGQDKYSHVYFKKWCKRYYCKSAVVILLSAAVIAASCIYMFC